MAPNAILKGGPAGALADHERIRHLFNLDEKVKVLAGNRYEHYEPTSETEPYLDGELRIFTWVGRTYVAE